MASRERKNSTSHLAENSPLDVHESNIRDSGLGFIRGRRRNRRTRKSRDLRRRQLVETLESRQLLAGPQLIGIQPNEGSLITDGTVRESSPRVLTFGFDDGQVLDSQTFDGIQISRAGDDGELGTDDDVAIEPGLVTLGDPNRNEIVVRFADSLPDDDYRIEVFGFDDAGLGVTGLRNEAGEFFVPSDPGQRSEVIDFKLSLGALVEAVVPQPVLRNSDGSLSQNRNEVVVYFNEDPLFVEDDDNGDPTARSAENPRFYQLLFTQETVRTTDDLLFKPEEVVYDEATHTARLFFSSDINELPGVPLEGGTWRLRIGTAVDDRVDLILPPQQFAVEPSAVTDFQHDGLRVTFAARQFGEAGSGLQVRFEDTGSGNLSVGLDSDGNVVFDFGGDNPTVDDLKDVVVNTPAVAAVLAVRSERNGNSSAGGDLVVPASVVGAPPLTLQAAGDTLTSSLDVGIFGRDNAITSLIVNESIDPQAYDFELAGGNDDPGHRSLDDNAGQLNRHVNPDFGADSNYGVTEIAYNFQGVFDRSGSTSFLNQIDETQKKRIREVLNLWADKLGVQFRETQDEGITIAVGDTGDLQSRPGTTLVNSGTPSFALQASMRIDPTFADSAIVFSNQANFQLDYGEDFTRKAAAAVGFILGLEQASELPDQTVMALNFGFLNQSIDTPIESVDLEPVFPGNYDVLHGQYLHRPDSVDIDMYRFEVDLDDDDKLGTLTVETFAERLADSSLLDTTLKLFQEVGASFESDLGFGSELGVTFRSMIPGRAGNGTEVRFIQSDRAAGDTAIRVNRVFDEAGAPIENAVLLDLPRRGPNVLSVTAQQVVDAINDDPYASSILRAEVTKGDPQSDISGQATAPLTVRLQDGGLEELSKNDDYFSEDSRIVASLGEGVYYVGVSASGNESYDPTIPGSGYGGRTQGDYELHFKFEPQVDEVDVIRDLDSERVGVPGTPLDGDGDGIPGGVHNFWFQTRPLNRFINFTDDGRAIVPGQEIEIVSGNGIERTYEFVRSGQAASPGNIAVIYNDGSSGFPTPAGNLAAALASAINLRQGETGVSVTRVGTGLEFTGDRSVNLSTNFRGANAVGRNIFVDKTAGPNADGSLDRPFNNIANPNVANAFGSAIDGDIVRIVGNGGVDGDLATETDNFSYKIGVSDVGGVALEDGRTMQVPKGVTTMIDAGAVLKMRASYAMVGSSTSLVDRSNGALQILGAPRLIEISRDGDPVATSLIGNEESGIGGYDDGSVIITSIRDRAVDLAAVGNSPAPAPADWGGLIYRRDFDQFEGRRNLEDEGIFLQHINHAEIRYGGSGNLLIDSEQTIVNPILIINMRPTITFNEITRSADSAISATPDSFEETSYQAPPFQQAGAFTADYDRVGPEIGNNLLLGNSVNGLFVRVPTTATQTPRSLNVAGRFDDVDVVHVLPENLVIASQPGGSIADGFAPSMAQVSARQLAGGSLQSGDYLYKMTFVDADGFESLASLDEFAFTVSEDDSSVELTRLPRVNSGADYVSRRLYRAEAGANPDFRLVADLDASSASFIDDLALQTGAPGQVSLDLSRQGIRGRLDASLVVDPGIVAKVSGARIELEPGAVMLAEGDASNPIAFTSLRDDRYGAGGTFDTNNDDGSPVALPPSHGDWAGIYAGPTSEISLDNSVIAYSGGISLFEGGETRGFVPVQLQQADGRITNSRFEFNDSGQDGAGPVGRFGRLAPTPSTIFVRGSQPIIVGNTFVDNDGSLIDIDSDSLTAERLIDTGRQTGSIDRFSELDDNFGPLVRFNRYEDNDLPGLDQITGMEIRGGTLTTESVWDDTDIVHLVFDSVIVDNVHSGGGLKLRSRPDESLVVKLGDQDSPFLDGLSSGQGTPNSATVGTGLTATGTPNDSIDRIGGSISIVGLPDAPVVLTSFRDDTVGAGLTPDGSQFTDNNGDKNNSRPEPNDWRSILLDQYSNDRNVDVIPERELSTEVAPGLNGDIANAQLLGELASDLTASDEVLRLGFEVEGFLSNPNDIDTYSFVGRPGTEVWVDIDTTSFTLDTVIELLDSDGNVLARSNDSSAEIANGSRVDVFDPRFEETTTSLQARDPQYSEFGPFGVYEDFNTTNPRDAGIHFTLTGNAADPNARSTYFFRVRSASINPDDAAGGLTRGGYRFQVRLTEDQEFPGSVVRYSDIRYANHGVHVRGLPGASPLLGEASENEAAAGESADNDFIMRPVPTDPFDDFLLNDPPQQRAQYLGNIVSNRNNVISVAGELGFSSDVDFYQIDLLNDDVANSIRSMIFDVDYAAGFNRPDTNISVFYDADGEFSDNFLPQLVLFGSDSNVLDDLTSPNGENDAREKLSRGSISTGDPLIGPVTLPEGTYYVAVTGAGQEPAAMSATQFVRREPVNSVRRIVEERFDPAETPSTAGGPVLDALFSADAISTSDFEFASDFLGGHGKPRHFDGSSGSTNFFNNRYSEGSIAGGDAPEVVGGALQAASLDAVDWSLSDDPEIGGAIQFVPALGQFTSENTSTFIPHVSVNGTLGNDLADFFEFTVDEDDSRVILDVDNGHDFRIPADPTSIATNLFLFRQDPVTGQYTLESTNNLSSTSNGRGGSLSVLDPFLERTLDAGTYVVGVVQNGVGVSVNNGVISVDDAEPAEGPLTYRLHVSVENHPLPTGLFGNRTLHFNRTANTAPSTISSQPFDLGGYTAEDLPTFYFNYRFQPVFGDDVEIRILSSENPTGRVIASETDLNIDESWFQIREDIGDFAGDSDVQIQVTYTPSAAAAGPEELGLFLDDFIIGFAERGETVFNAPAGADGFVGFANGGAGEYQLEARPGTEYARRGSGVLNLQSDFDTNDRHTQAITIVAPAGSQISDGDTFVIGDGAFNQTFEFTTTPGSVAFGNTGVVFSSTDTPAEVAEAIREALRLQTSISIEASSSAGEDTGALSDGRLALSGSARGTFLSIPTAAHAPDSATPLDRDADGNLLLPAILHDGYGDQNYLRTQGQVLIDSNTISDVRAIGVWSEPGTRDVDPEDIRDNDAMLTNFPLIDGNHPFLQLPPVGNTYPGYARNLPTLNDSVLGGLSPGLVVTNNTIDNAGYSGVKLDGETAPYVLDVRDLIVAADNDATVPNTDGGRVIREGALMTIDAGGTRVTFEFEEIDGVPAPLGSGTQGGNGVQDGHVPIYFRNDTASPYNYPLPDRDSYSSIELATSIMQSIQGSILVNNGLVELVTPTIGPSPYRRNRGLEATQDSPMDYDSAAVYLQGVTDIYFSGPGQSAISVSQAPVAESTQPFARVVNNTIYGSDGRETLFPQSNDESNDVIADAIDTKLGPSHRSEYSSTANIGDNARPVAPAGDVDFYRVNLDVGDRLIVDIDTVDGGADTAVQIFNGRGERQSFLDLAGNSVTVNTQAAAPTYLDPQSTALPNGDVVDEDNSRDAFVDFFAPAKGVYYVAVSGENNVDFDPNALSGRAEGTDDVGAYTIRMKTFAPRTHVISANSNSATGLTGAALLGVGNPTFTVTQVPDLNPNAIVNGRTNRVTFRFGPPQAPNEVGIPVVDGDFLPDIMRKISAALEPPNTGASPLPNNDSFQSPGPIARVRATALGGIEGENYEKFDKFGRLVDPGIVNTSRRGLRGGVLITHRDGAGPPVDFTTSLSSLGDPVGFGHDRRTTPGNGTTENYVFVENAAEIDLHPDLVSAGLRLDPQPGFDTDQLINETGVMITQGSSPALLNNVFLNLHESVVVEQSSFAGFGVGSRFNPKPMEVVVVGSVFQHDETQPTLFNQAPAITVGLTTDAGTGPSNVNGGTDDFNITNANSEVTLVNPGGDNFLPAPFSTVIDQNVDSLRERSAFENLKQSVGIPVSNVLAPTRDVTGVKRADNPLYPNTGQGSAVFGDRGSVELADFVGPVAIAEVPRDNDAEGIDGDPNVSFISLSGGVYEEFRVQLRDSGDASDPFAGSGIDDQTVVVAEIPGVRPTGANVALFEDDRLLVEGVDYTFNYDETKNIITLTPLAGIWQNDRAYRIQLNNRDRTVLTAPDATQVADGDQVRITDSNGGQVVFEFESGYLIQMPEPITLEVPAVGTNQGGLIDGGIFTIDDGTNPPVVFELDSDGTSLPNSVRVDLPSDPTPTDADELEVFLTGIAEEIRQTIQDVVDSGTRTLNVDVRVVGTSVVIGAEAGARADVSTSGLVSATRTIGLQVPEAGAGVGGVTVGETFDLTDGTNSETFEFVDANTTPTPGFVPIDITPVGGIGTAPMTTQEVAIAIQNAILGSNLELDPSITGDVVYLGLTDDGAVNVPASQLRAVSISRTPSDGDLIVFTPNDNSPQVIFEINRTDEPGPNDTVIDDGVDQNNFPIDITRQTTGEELASLIAGEIQTKTIPGLNAGQVTSVGGGLLSVGGQTGLGLAVSGNSLQVIGAPDVTGPSTLEIFGDLLLQVPFGTPNDGDFFTIFDVAGNPYVLEFDNNTVLNNPTAIRVPFTRFDDLDTISGSVATAINNSPAGINATYQLGGAGQIRLGRIDEARVNTTGSTLSTQRGIVGDGEAITISQGGLSVTYEFESVNNGGGVSGTNVPVPFQPGSTTLDVANSLAAAINSNPGQLRITAEVVDGNVLLRDLPGTIVDVTAAPTLILSGVPGGAIPVSISPADSAFDIKRALLTAINSVNEGPEGVVTTLAAQDRGGNTLFVENGVIFDGPVTSYYLPAIRDLQGVPLEANRADNTTQFTILMPTVALDYGDAPDPLFNVPGRYPTLLANDGARHVVVDGLHLGNRIDADADGLPSRDADGDDAINTVSTTGALFTATIVGGEASVNVNVATVDPLTRDGDTITISTGVTTATLEFDLNGRFDEDNFAIRPDPNDPGAVDSILQAIEAAIIESPLEPAGIEFVGTSIVINGDDEDGVSFVSDRNPGGVFNRNVVTPIEFTVTGNGVLQGWIDYDGDGDWSPSEAIQFYDENADPAISTPRDSLTLTGDGTRSFVFDTYFPVSSPDPITPTETTARFRFSRTGDLSPTGLALSGEVEDYQVLLVPGAPPALSDAQLNRSFTVNEGQVLQALDNDGALTPAVTTDDGLLAGVFDPDGDNVAIFPEDATVRTLTTANGTVAGELDLQSDGTFTFRPEDDFNGAVSFTARVTDVKFNPETQLVNSEPITVTIDVLPVNDQPFATTADVETSRTIEEDDRDEEDVIFTAEQLIDPFYVAGPDNELGQPLVFQSVSSQNLGDSVSSLGGILEILPDGKSIRYTPPADYNGPDPDIFNYVVADVPGGNLIPQAADKLGTVSISFVAVNDAPIAGDDLFTDVEEDTPYAIAINGSGSIVGILDNDRAGPQNEVDPPENQTIRLVTEEFPSTDPPRTQRGGTVSFENGALVYRPPGLYSGPDSFTYTIEDNLGERSTGTVSIVVGGQNDAPRFEGVDGEKINGLPVETISLPESKPNAQSTQYDLSTWFSDPEGDTLTYDVSVPTGSESVLQAMLDGSTLTLTRTAFAFGDVPLTVTATETGNPSNLSTSKTINVEIENENDPPVVAQSLDPLTADEDDVIVEPLSSVFRDPDNDDLDYVVTRLGSLIRPTPEQITDHPLVASIDTVGDQLRITLEPDQSGQVDIEIEASDEGGFRVNDAFTLTVNPIADAPVANDDAYNVPVGSTLRVLNPADGVLRNDVDADGDSIEVDLNSVTQPTLGTLAINADGTFTYTNTSGVVGNVDSFQYRIVDSTNRTSEVKTVQLTLNRSRYQNPIDDRAADVNADGVISPIDALRVINLIERESGGTGEVLVSQIGTPPPDFYDVNGDGTVSPLDALIVITELGKRQASGGEGESVSGNLAAASGTRAFASLSSDFLPTSNVTAVQDDERRSLASEDPEKNTDALLTAGIQIETVSSDSAESLLIETEADALDEDTIDSVLTDLSADLEDSFDF
jgi:hypothetical protein